MKGPVEWGRFGWHGVAFDMPEDWCPGRLEGDFANGYVRIEDETEVRAELRWETARRRVAPASKFVDSYIRQVRKKTRRQDPDPQIERDRCVKQLGDVDHEVFTWRGVFSAHSLLAVCPTTRRVVHLRVERTDTPFTSRYRQGQVIRIPIAHNEGNYYLPGEQLEELEAARQVVFRYCDSDGAVTAGANPNGSVNNIAGIVNREGNVLGMMPHPERRCDPLLGDPDGAPLFHSMIDFLTGG